MATAPPPTTVPTHPDLLLTRLISRAQATPNKLLFEFCGDDASPLGKYTYAEFERATGSLARKLVARGKKGTTALLVYPPGLDFIVAFVACLRAGIVAVPVYPPRGAKNKDLAMFLAVHSSCNATIALTNSLYNWATRVQAMRETVTGMFSRKKGDAEEEQMGVWPETLEWIVTDTLGGNEDASPTAIDQAKPDDVAFLQYTSGSTSLPKGVVLTHGNLAHNLSTIMVALKASDHVVVVSWLPMYHDMGLIGSHLGTIYCGGSATIFSPLSFVKNPPMWIELASARKATHLQAPNFAYRLTIRKFLAKQQTAAARPIIDLSSVEHVFNAAEPIDPSAIDEFCDIFGKYGFRKEAMVPGYGLAEHTVYVCDGGKQRLSVSRRILEQENRCEFLAKAEQQNPDEMILVGCGAPPMGSNIHVLIVDPKTKRKLQEGFVGEIWLSSPSKSSAYFGMEEKTRSDLQAKLAENIERSQEEEKSVSGEMKTEGESRLERAESSGSTADRNGSAQFQFVDATAEELSLKWLRTGDLGVWYSSELFICGRIKDLLIVRGRNHFPQDIEASVERVDRTKIRPGCSAAFTVLTDSKGEAVVVCAEVRVTVTDKKELDELMSKIRVAVAREHGISPYAIVLLMEHTIPKTTSGKISRHRVKNAYLAGKLKQVAVWMTTKEDEGDDAEATMAAEGGEAQPAAAGRASVPVLATAPMVITKLSGDELLQKLKNEAASLLEHDPVTMDANAPMPELGFDSMMLTQFKGAVRNTLGADLPDEQLYDEKCTLNKIRMLIEDMADKETMGGADGDAPVPIGQQQQQQQKRKKQPLFGSWKSGQKCGFCGC